MSEKISTEGRPRRRRSDAERSVARILDAATRTIGQRPEATIEEVAAAAGLTRQTVHAHFPSRADLLAAVVDRATTESLAAMDAADLDRGTPTEALCRLLDAGWQTMADYPALLHLSPAEAEPNDERHEPVLHRLFALVRRGQATGEFDPDLDPAWLLTATVALGHAMAGEVAAGRMAMDTAPVTLRETVLRVYGATAPDTFGPPAAETDGR